MMRRRPAPDPGKGSFDAQFQSDMISTCTLGEKCLYEAPAPGPPRNGLCAAALFALDVVLFFATCFLLYDTVVGVRRLYLAKETLDPYCWTAAAGKRACFTNPFRLTTVCGTVAFACVGLQRGLYTLSVRLRYTRLEWQLGALISTYILVYSYTLTLPVVPGEPLNPLRFVTWSVTLPMCVDIMFAQLETKCDATARECKKHMFAMVVFGGEAFHYRWHQPLVLVVGGVLSLGTYAYALFVFYMAFEEEMRVRRLKDAETSCRILKSTQVWVVVVFSLYLVPRLLAMGGYFTEATEEICFTVLDVLNKVFFTSLCHDYAFSRWMTSVARAEEGQARIAEIKAAVALERAFSSHEYTNRALECIELANQLREGAAPAAADRALRLVTSTLEELVFLSRMRGSFEAMVSRSYSPSATPLDLRAALRRIVQRVNRTQNAGDADLVDGTDAGWERKLVHIDALVFEIMVWHLLQSARSNAGAGGAVAVHLRIFDAVKVKGAPRCAFELRVVHGRRGGDPRPRAGSAAYATMESNVSVVVPVCAHALADGVPATWSRTVGATTEEVVLTHPSLPATTPAPAVEPAAFPPKARLVHLDDSAMMRKMFAKFANKVLPGLQLESFEATEGLVENVFFSAHDARRGPVVAVVLDQNLGAKDPPHVKGMDVARELRLRGFDGVIAAMSANDTDVDRAAYMEAGCDAVISKATALYELKPALVTAHAARYAARAERTGQRIRRVTSRTDF
ncbi:hypothetical protein M885DRAFT_510654 [Pelagophyceae sp. CCMP2097]|nr:hypothetical protein M885DRAFT_510654 [Pelagophyceae sp. CCMP2097]|mmetsp:Transcript_4155/g.12933  ORF Transcript_4155/g.12933 Transcript_4155/m.12933 type:complete len:739 (+) Transcript_4155:102-2318(+)